jgi:hypothetical protein
MKGIVKRVLLWAAGVLVFFALAVLLFLWMASKQEHLARELAKEGIVQLLSDKTQRAANGVPADVELDSNEPVDTNLFERTWDFRFRLKPRGSVVIHVSARRGIAFVPIFNRKSDLSVTLTEYSP